MPKLSLIIALGLLLAVLGCASTSPPPVRFLDAPRPRVPALPADLATKREPTLCRELLRTFNASPVMLRDLCEITTPSSTDTTPPAPLATPG